MSNPVRTACSERPNDNPGLHRGAIWFGAEVTGSPIFERPDGYASIAAVDDAPAPVPAPWEAEEEGNDIEIVDELAFDDAVDESAAPAEATLVEYAIPPECASPCSDPFATLVSVVEEVAHGAGADDVAMASLACLLGRTRLDASTPDETAHVLRAQALAWQGILRSESDDFGACGGAMLDEWCAALIATVLGPTARADMLKRDLRRRGVAAFGLVEQAA